MEIIFGERLKSARLRSGLSLRQLAEKVGVSAQAISKYERGLDVPGSEILLRLCHTLNVTVEFLLRPLNVSLSEPAFRCFKTKLKKKDKQIILETVKDWIERYLSIEELVGEQQIFKYPEINSTVDKPEDVESIANDLRDAWSLGSDPIPSIIDTLERKGIKIGLIPAVNNFDGLMLIANENIPIICVNENFPGDRQRLSIAHELGHLILKMPHNWSSMEIEKVSMRFGAAFLVPREAVLQELGERRTHISLDELHLLKHRYGISMQAWIHRAFDLNVINESVFKKLYYSFRKNNWHKKEPGDEYLPEKTFRMEQLVMRALSEGIITENRARELLGKPIRDLGEI